MEQLVMTNEFEPHGAGPDNRRGVEVIGPPSVNDDQGRDQSVGNVTSGAASCGNSAARALGGVCLTV